MTNDLLLFIVFKTYILGLRPSLNQGVTNYHLTNFYYSSARRSMPEEATRSMILLSGNREVCVIYVLSSKYR